MGHNRTMRIHPLITRSDDLKAQYAKQDAVAAPTTPAEFAAFVTAEQVKWKAVVAATGVRFE